MTGCPSKIDGIIDKGRKEQLTCYMYHKLQYVVDIKQGLLKLHICFSNTPKYCKNLIPKITALHYAKNLIFVQKSEQKSEFLGLKKKIEFMNFPNFCENRTV